MCHVLDGTKTVTEQEISFEARQLKPKLVLKICLKVCK